MNAPANNAKSNVLRRIWWLDPQIVFAISTAGTMLLAVLSPVAFFQEYGTPKYVDWGHFGLAVIAVGAFIGGCYAGRLIDPGPADTDHMPRSYLVGWFLFGMALTAAAYVIWIGLAVRNGLSMDLILRFLFVNDDQTFTDIKTKVFVRIPGITTAVHFAAAAVLIGLVACYRGSRWVLLPIGVLLGITLVRALINSERLAFIEIVLPAFILVFRLLVLGKPASAWLKWTLRLLPFAGIAALITLFGTFEYFRSWRAHQKKYDSIVEFTLLRFSGYYNTANNNGAMLLDHGWKYPLPFGTLQFYWQFPLVKRSPFSYYELTRMDTDEQYFEMLRLYANEELNNDGGLFQPVFDYGLLGLPLFWGAVGVVCGWAYRSFLSGRLAGLLLYPLLMIGILEVPRYMYFTSQRVLPTVLLVVAFLVFERFFMPRTATVGKAAVA